MFSQGKRYFYRIQFKISLMNFSIYDLFEDWYSFFLDEEMCFQLFTWIWIFSFNVEDVIVAWNSCSNNYTRNVKKLGRSKREIFNFVIHINLSMSTAFHWFLDIQDIYKLYCFQVLIGIVRPNSSILQCRGCIKSK